MRMATAAGGEGAGVPVVTLPPPADDPDVEFEPVATADAASLDGPRRPLIIGGAMASAALSLAGAAFVAWLRSRPTGTPMSRAVRAARHSRVARLGPLPSARRPRLD
jgi:hypothetical protein